MFRILPVTLLILFCSGCVGIPDNVEAVKGFELKRYLGTWYEIARLDHTFEKGLTANVTAEYTMMEDGGIQILNRGQNPKTGEYSEAKGKGYLAAEPDIGRFKVAFFVPIYFGYNIIELDKENYSYVMICGKDRSNFWILSRKPVLEKETFQKLVGRGKELGFDTDNLIMIKHTP